ncbi:hypothetical protein LZ554_002177 [Drepanopeziza brunnea f. sp. 'monogermtubi']|nr:hypothetical protein LZ554_002177 [Drepanopeziza brunnea f. sp. 'monogermtubi']
MSTADPSPAPAVGSGRGRRRGLRRGGPPGGGASGNTAPNSSLALRPASIAPEAQALTQLQPHTQRTQGRASGRRGGYRGRGRGAAQLMVNGQRAFGGQLTAATPNEGSLAGDAPEFVPGQPVASRVRQQQPRILPKRRMSKSQAPDIATRTHEDITNGHLELQDLLVGLAFVLCEEMVQERGFDTPTASCGERGTATPEAMAMSGMQSAQARSTEQLFLLV